MLDPKYIVGLVDGEGSFTAYVRDPDSSKVVNRRARVEPKFYLKLIEEDKKILYALKKYFGCGAVYFQKDTRVNHRDCYRYEVANRRDLEQVIIPFFKENALQLRSKRRDFEIFCQIFKLVNQNNHLAEKGFRKIFLLKQKMH